MKSNNSLIGLIRSLVVAAVFGVASVLGVAQAEERGMSMGHEGMMDHEMGHQRIMGHEMGHEGMIGRGMMCRMGEHVEGRLAYLKTELKITDAQLPEWNAFADAFRAHGKEAAQHCATMKGHDGSKTSASLPERLDMMEKHMTMHVEGFHKIKAALLPLYSVLSNEQKKAADELLENLAH